MENSLKCKVELILVIFVGVMFFIAMLINNSYISCGIILATIMLAVIVRSYLD